MPGRIRSSASPLASDIYRTVLANTLTILSGPSCSGKTSSCILLADQVHNLGFTVEGLVSPARMAGAEKIGLDLINLATGERREFAQRLGAGSKGHLTHAWCIDPDTLAWGNEVLRDVAGTGVVIVDEIGPLELQRGVGLMSGLELIDQQRFRHACIVIRLGLLDLAHERWPDTHVITLPDLPNSTLDVRDDTP